jgi:hypothetical protein
MKLVQIVTLLALMFFTHFCHASNNQTLNMTALKHLSAFSLGSGENQLVLVLDVSCPYSRKLYKEVETLHRLHPDANIRTHIVLSSKLSPDFRHISLSVALADNNAQAQALMSELMQYGRDNFPRFTSTQQEHDHQTMLEQQLSDMGIYGYPTITGSVDTQSGYTPQLINELKDLFSRHSGTTWLNFSLSD